MRTHGSRVQQHQSRLAEVRGSHALGVLLGLLAVGACRPGPGAREAAPEPTTERRDLELDAEQHAFLQQLARAADAAPHDFAARKASGLAHMQFTLAGALRLRDRAEADLEAAFAIDPSDPDLTRALGRFYNMRAVAGDDSKAELQVTVYRALLGDREPTQMDTRLFVAWSFSQLGAILVERKRGRLLSALGRVRALEQALAERARADPDDVEIRALLGNFAFFFAGNIPFDRMARVRTAVDAFTDVRARWSRLRAHARHPILCPNTYENFMFELAEGHLVLGEREPASEIYRELARPTDPITRAKEQIAFVSAERLRNLEHYVGELDLMPPWPSDVGNCIVCHAYTSDVPFDSLHAIERPSLEDIPTRARRMPTRVP